MMLMLIARGAEPFDPAPPATPVGLPYNAVTTCTTPTYDGSGNITHPSVVDMGRKWHGYRWWLVDTPLPYTPDPDNYENPSIWGSNDRVTWEVPGGLTNPIDPWPGGEVGKPETAFNSDPELVWDPDGQRMVVYWREAASSSPAVVDFYAATSTDGVTWTHEPGIITSLLPTVGMRSPGIARVSATDWRMWALHDKYPSAMYSAPGPLGPWTPSGQMVTSLGAPIYGWHGDVIYDRGLYYSLIGDVPDVGPFRPGISLDGLTWHVGDAVFGAGYRSTMLPPRDGVVEVWYSRARLLRYTRIPASYWTDLLPA